MLRLDEDLSDFHARCAASAAHRAAARLRFGRLLRSATLFEDIVKVICTCNVTWRQTVAMVGNLVTHWGVATADGVARGFPTPLLLARASVDDLRTRGRLGYRAGFVHQLAEDIVEGRLDLASIEACTESANELCRRLKQITGIGNYAAGHLCMLLGRYDRLAIDTEMMRHLRSRHPRRRWTPAGIERYYRPWQPYQFLAYWFELWQDYERQHGRADQWNPATDGSRITRRR
jgi:3-methyladenine DNA glycosylase/8-oxoguanine DNA glycosylase